MTMLIFIPEKYNMKDMVLKEKDRNILKKIAEVYWIFCLYAVYLFQMIYESISRFPSAGNAD